MGLIFDGEVTDGDLVIEADSKKVVEWAQTIFDTHDYQPNPIFAEEKSRWIAEHGSKQSLKQSYRQISVEEALTRL